MRGWRWILCLLLAAPSWAAANEPRSAAAASQPRPALFALVLGVNRSVDADLTPLRYADDDAARYLDLFRTLGARTYLLARLDENTSRLHPQAVAEARPPQQAALTEAVGQLADDIARARAPRADGAVLRLRGPR